MSQETVYVKFNQDIICKDPKVTVKELGTVTGKNRELVRHIQQISVYNFQKTQKIHVISIMKVIESIQKEYPNVDVQNLGETDFIVEYVPKEENQLLQILKVVVVCIIIYLGAAYTIMAFHNDVGIHDVFAKFYFQVTGQKSDGFTVLEVCYSIGLALGILVFFNHFGNQKITDDPTPLQVQMRKYQKDVNDTYVTESGRGGMEEDAN